MLTDLINASFALESTAFSVQVLLGIAALGILCLAARAASRAAIWHSLVVITPSTLATVGVLGTFYGIWMGLQDFDVAAIDESVPTLLEGLKTAFVTSLWGMALSVAFRVLAVIVPARSNGASGALEALNRLCETQERTRAEAETSSGALRRAIAGDEEASLVGQIARLRTDLGDRLHAIEHGLGERLDAERADADTRHAALLQSLDTQGERLREDGERRHEEHMSELREFARHMVENTHRALIEALEDVIRDFNEQLTTQFGDNFRELNAAVGRLVIWQDQYREHVESLEERIERTLEATERVAATLAEIERSTASIPAGIEPLAPVLGTIESTLARLHNDLTAHAELHDKARAALPLVNQNLDAMTDGLRGAVTTLIERSDASLVRQERSHDTLEAGYTGLLEQAEDAQRSFMSAVDTTMVRVDESLREACDRVSRDVETTLTDTDRRMKEQITRLDEQLGSELERALRTMGDNLGSMSERFVNDYEPLTRELGELVRLARAANAPQRDRAS